MSDIVCTDCGELMDQSDACSHAEKCNPPSVADLQAIIRELRSHIVNLEETIKARQRIAETLATLAREAGMERDEYDGL